MNEVEKMRSSQLADMSVPEIQVKFEHAKRLLAKMRVMSTYDEDYRSLLEELVPGIPATSIICPPFHCDHGDGIRLGESCLCQCQLHFPGRGIYHDWCPYVGRSMRTDIHSPSSDGLYRASYGKGICLSGDDRRGLLDWRRCHFVSRRHHRRPLYHRCG